MFSIFNFVLAVVTQSFISRPMFNICLILL